MKLQVCDTCGEPLSLKGYDCQNCCDHDPDPQESYMCVNCGADCFEDVTARAHDRAKDLRKYGEFA